MATAHLPHPAHDFTKGGPRLPTPHGLTRQHISQIVHAVAVAARISKRGYPTCAASHRGHSHRHPPRGSFRSQGASAVVSSDQIIATQPVRCPTPPRP
jgi:hypothetical protein